MSSVFTSQADGPQQQQPVQGTPHYQYDPNQYQHMNQPSIPPGYNMRPPGMHPNMPVPHPSQPHLQPSQPHLQPPQPHLQPPQQLPQSQAPSPMVNHKMSQSSTPVQSGVNQPHSQPPLSSQMPPQIPPQAAPQMPPQMGSQMPPQMAPPGSVQKLLDENNQFIQLLLDYQAKGKHQECAEYQKLLHRNLVYLATVADANNQSIQSSSSGAPNITLPSPNVNAPHNMNGHPS